MIYTISSIYHEGIIMSLSFGLLGLLRYSESTGYDLAKLYKEALSSFWHAGHSQIHRELNRMEDEGWIASQTVAQEGKPNKRVFSITDKGRKIFAEWMCAPASPFPNRHNPLLKHIFFGAANREETLQRLRAVRDEWIADLEPHIQKNEALIDSYKQNTQNGETESMYWRMVLEYGIAEARMIINWAQNCIDKLESGDL